MSAGNGDWPENRKYVLEALKDIAADVKGVQGDVRGVQSQLVELDKRFSALNVRSTVWGAFGGIVVTGIVYALARRFIGVLVVALLMMAVTATAAPQPPHVVVVMADDLDKASTEILLAYGFLPNIQQYIAGPGVKFANAFATNPICAPSRATYLTGRYPHNSGVLRNDLPNGGFSLLAEGTTLPVALEPTYRTVHVGKYLNGYDGGHVPQGWDDWQGLIDPSTYSVFNYQINANGATVSHGAAPEDYQTAVLGDLAAASITAGLASGKPLFLSVTPLAPHIEVNDIDLWTFADGAQYSDIWRLFIRPDPRDQAAKPQKWAALSTFPLLPNLKPSFNEADVSDKFLQRPLMNATDIQWLTFGFRTRLLSLLAVDDLVGKIAAALGPEAANTTWIFTSDNGFYLGEHRLGQKMAPYEEGARVPLYIAGPGTAPTTQQAIALNTDLAPTIRDLAGVAPDPLADGRSLVPLLHGTVPVDWRRRFLLEHWGEPGQSVFDVPTYAAVRTGPSDAYPWRLYVEWDAGARELYDLAADPYQIQSLHADPSRAAEISILHGLLASLKACAGSTCVTAEGPQ